MRVLSVVFVLVLCICAGAASVQVKVSISCSWNLNPYYSSFLVGFFVQFLLMNDYFKVEDWFQDLFQSLTFIYSVRLSYFLAGQLFPPQCSCFFPPQVGDRNFPLEAAKELKKLMELGDNVSPHLSETSVLAVCDNPLLPQIFRPVCQGKGAGIVFSRLGKHGMDNKKVHCSQLNYPVREHQFQRGFL